MKNRLRIDRILRRLGTGKGLRPDEYNVLTGHVDSQARYIGGLLSDRDRLADGGCTQSPKCVGVCTCGKAATQGFSTVMKIADLNPPAKRKPAAKRKTAAKRKAAAKRRA